MIPMLPNNLETDDPRFARTNDSAQFSFMMFDPSDEDKILGFLPVQFWGCQDAEALRLELIKFRRAGCSS